MRRHFIHIFAAALASLVCSCSEWTETESIGITVKNIETSNPELYAAYCQSLKDYKASDHKMMYVAFTATETCVNHSQNILSLPDSVDVVEITNPEMTSAVLSGMEKLRSDYGTRFSVRISRPDILAAYEAIEAEAEADTTGGVTVPEYSEYESSWIQERLDLIEEFGYDCVTVAYESNDTLQLTDAEMAAYTAEQAAFFEPIITWLNANSGKAFFLETRPQFLLDQTITAKAECVILPTSTCYAINELAYEAMTAVSFGSLPDGCKFLYSVDTPNDDYFTGMFHTGEQIPVAAEWMTESADYSKGGLAVWNVQRAYFDVNHIYSTVRNAINTMNPNS